MIFDISRIERTTYGRFICSAKASSKNEAEDFVARFLASVRSTYPLCELYTRGTSVLVDSPNRNLTIQIAKHLNNSQL